jgi:hypothetical protein
MRLRANPKLESVDGLQQVNLLGVLEVSENPRLPQCQAEQLGDFLGLPPERRDIHTNLDTCPNARRGLLDMEP